MLMKKLILLLAVAGLLAACVAPTGCTAGEPAGPPSQACPR